MLATGACGDEFNDLLKKGWRRFGYYFFKPSCRICYECLPIRVRVCEFKLTKSQKRVIKKNIETKVLFKELSYSEEIFEIYKEHSWDKFNQKADKEDFKLSFFYQAVPSLQSEYYINDKLAAVGFIDISSKALSSVYFIYRTVYSHYSLGTFGAIKEIEFARLLSLKYYYLGYYIKDNHRMSYKNRFKPYELYDWKKRKWNLFNV